MVAKLELVSLKQMGDDRGALVVFEKGMNIPFDVKRCFYIYGTKKGVARGFHAHKKSKQILVAVSGSVEIHCEANGKSAHPLSKEIRKATLEELRRVS